MGSTASTSSSNNAADTSEKQFSIYNNDDLMQTKQQPTSIRITKNATDGTMPDSFNVVRVTDSVIDRLRQRNFNEIDGNNAGAIPINVIMEMLKEEHETNELLHEELKRLQQHTGSSPSKSSLTTIDIDERKRQFEASFERVTSRFFAPSSNATACSDRERAIVDCLTMNRRHPLNCLQDANEFRQCVDDQRARWLTRST